jgi:hypothetical protein
VANIRVTRFPRNTRYAVLVPNEQPFDCRVIKRVARTTKKALPVQLRLPLFW